jgi:Uma2 family endonuclease
MFTDAIERDASIEDYFNFLNNCAPNDTRFELIEGEIVAMSPEGSYHYAHIKQLNRVLMRALGDEAIIGIQDPVKLGLKNVPLPDVSILKPKKGLYKNALPEPKDILLLIEVSDTTLARDRGKKLSLYAQAGIVEVWILVVESGALEVYRQPMSDHYAQQLSFSGEDRVAMLTFPDLLISVSDLIP